MNFDEDWAPFGSSAAAGAFSSAPSSLTNVGSLPLPLPDFPVGGPGSMLDTFPFHPKALGLQDGDLALDGCMPSSSSSSSSFAAAAAYQPVSLDGPALSMSMAGFSSCSSSLPLPPATCASLSSSSSSAACGAMYEPFLMEPSPVASTGSAAGDHGAVSSSSSLGYSSSTAFTFASVSGMSSSTETSPASPPCLSTPDEQASGCGDFASDTSHDDDIKLMQPMSPIRLPPLDTPMASASSGAGMGAAGFSTPRAFAREQLIMVKQEPSDGSSSPDFSSVSSPSPSVPLPPAPPADDGKGKKKKKGRKRKAPPLLSDLDLNLDDDDDDLDDTSNLDKKERNKLSAAKYRKRKKLYIGKLEQLNSNLQSTLADQKEKMAAMATENGVLKSQLVFFKKLLAQSNISLTDGRVPTSMAKQAGAVLFVLFSFFVITTPFWCSLDSPAAVPHGAAFSSSLSSSSASAPAALFSSPRMHDHSVPGMKGRVLLSMNEDVSCECSGTSPMLDNLTTLLSQLQISAHGDVSLPADAHHDVTFDAQLLQLNASHVLPASTPASASAAVPVAASA